MEMNNLILLNEPTNATRIGLHSSQKDTSPDITFASPGLIITCKTFDTTWGSDYFPISIYVLGKRLRTAKTLKLTKWTAFCETLNQSSDPITGLPTFITRIQNAAQTSIEHITCSEDTSATDGHLANLWNRAGHLTRKYRRLGKRHCDLVKLRHQYKLTPEYQKIC